MTDFIIPESRDDLLKKTAVNQYVVEEVLSRSRLPSAVQEFKQACRNRQFAVAEHFDTVFSILVVQRDIDSELVEETWHSLLKGCKLLHTNLATTLEDVDISSDVRQNSLKAAKMVLYLLCQFIEMYEAEASQSNLLVLKKGRGRQQKQAQTKSGMDWEVEKEEGVRAMVQLVQLPLQKLWDPPVPEEDFVSMVSSCLYRLLENPSIASARSKETRDAISHGIGALVKRYNHALGAVYQITQLLKHFEHLVSPLAQMVENIVNQYGYKSVVGDIMREISRMDPKDVLRDTSGTKAYAQFLVELGEKVPAAVLPNISVVLSHLDEESYTLRNGVLGMIGEILIQILSKEGLDSHHKVARDRFFDRLQVFDDIQADVDKQASVEMLQTGSCGLHVIHNAFRAGCVAANWDIEEFLTRLYILFQDCPARRQDFMEVTGQNKFPLKFCTHRWLENIQPAERTLELLPHLSTYCNAAMTKNVTEPRNASFQIVLKAIQDPLIAAKLHFFLVVAREDHIHDSNAFVRSRVLQIWLKIVNEKCLPLLRQEQLLELVLGRLQDVSSQVRRYSIQLVTAILKCNPFAANLSANELAMSYEKEKVKLEELMPPESVAIDSARTVEQLEEEWEKILPELTEKFAELEENAESSAIEDDCTSESILDTIYTLMMEEYYISALQLVQEAHAIWPFLKVFQSSPGCEEAEMKEFYPITALKNIFFEQRSPDLVKITEAATNNSQSRDSDTGEVNAISKQQLVVQYLKDSLAFARQMQEAVPILCQLLGSKNTSDVFEAVEFFVTAYEFGVAAALHGVRRMLVLVWSKDQSVREVVVSAYRRLYLESTTGSPRNRALSVVKNLSKLIYGATYGDLTSLEALTMELMWSGDLSPQVIQVLWERFTMKIPDTTPQESRAALLLISMVAGAKADIVGSNLEVLMEEGLGPRADTDPLLAQAVCQAILKLAPKKKKGQSLTEPFRFPPEHHLFARLVQLLVSGMKTGGSGYWIPLAERVVTLIYQLADQPDCVCGNLVRQLAEVLMNETKDKQSEGELNEQASSMLTKLLAMTGQVALQQLVHMEVAILGELKRRNALQENNEDKKNKANDKRKSVAAEEEMGLAGASADDAEAEYIRKLCEKDVVTGNNLLAAMQPVLVAVCTNPGRYPHTELRTAATLALAKFMAVSSEFCEQQLQLMFTIMEKYPSDVIRANSIIAVGDLTFRFPNLIEPWTPHLYGRLRDESRLVRQYTMQVLTHLILNDMVKVKGQISELASCIVDNDDQISGLAKLFFHELAKKGNALYNILPDAISRLSDPEIGVEEEHFQIIMKHLFSFIQKDKMCESLVEKLCHRFRVTVTDRQCRDLSFCLSLLSYNDRSFRKLQENLSCFADKLVDDSVYACFTTIIAKSRGGLAKPEAKVLVDELEEKLEQCHRKGLDEGEVALRASKSSNAAQQVGSKRKGKTPARSTKTPGRKRGRGKENLDEDEDFEDDGQAAANSPAPAIKRNTRRKPQPKLVFDSDDDDDDDDDMFVATRKDKSACLEAESPVAARSRGGRVPLGKYA